MDYDDVCLGHAEMFGQKTNQCIIRGALDRPLPQIDGKRGLRPFVDDDKGPFAAAGLDVHRQVYRVGHGSSVSGEAFHTKLVCVDNVP